jgi:formate dehydrogenase subunit delta
MHIEKLVSMANDIANFFNAESDKEIAAEGVKKHILRSWDPRMKKAIIASFGSTGCKKACGDDLNLRQAVQIMPNGE